MTMAIAPLETVRALIASVVLEEDAVPAQLGEIELRPHQRRAASRLVRLIARRGGAMLAEPVGVGKTYTALAVAARAGGGILVATPASLVSMWRDAARRCHLAIDVVSHEALSRGRSPRTPPRFVIVDEAHRVRTHTTRRYAMLADLCQRSSVLLVTATPIQNATRDLTSQLALFLGRTARAMTDDQLSELVVRDSTASLSARPRLDGPHRIELGLADDCLDDLLALPPPVPAKGESLAAALLTYGLVHQWASSRAALVAALKRRRARGLALASALDAGRRPTRAELSAWTYAGDAMQLAFPELVTSDGCDALPDDGAMRVAVEAHNEGVALLIRRIRNTPDPDTARAESLRRIRKAHPGERIIAFCQYAETVDILRANLAGDAGIAALTAHGARVAGGKIRREDVIAQFTPSRVPRATEATHIDLLITTDLLSEGLNLQEASVIVHLDLPWNPARLDQRVGRALRLGSHHAAVTVYSIAPPAPAERLLRIESRLREKLNVAQRTIGVAGRILPSPLGASPPSPALAEQRSAFDAELRRWGSSPLAGRVAGTSVVAAVVANRRGFLALVQGPNDPTLVADLGAGIDVRTPTIAAAIAACAGAATTPDLIRANDVALALGRWLSARQGATSLNLEVAGVARARRDALTRVAQALARVPRHRRAQLAPLADAARAVATVQLGEGAERVLELLVRSQLPDEAWLRSLAAFGELNARGGPATPINEPSGNDIVAIVLLEPTPAV